MAKAVISKKPKKESANQDPEKWVSHQFEFQHHFLVSVKEMDGGEPVMDVGTWEEVQEEIREVLLKRFPHGKFTPSGGYILIREDDARVRACYPQDFDYETMSRKPGTVPPLYTLSQEEQKEVRDLQRQVEQRAVREAATGNSLARNPTNLLTARETDRLDRIRNGKRPGYTVRVGSTDPGSNVTSVEIKPAGRDIKVSSTDLVEWTEQDADNEKLVEEETSKLLGAAANGKRRPVRLVRRK